MFGVIIPVAVAALAFGAALRKPKNYGVLTPERKAAYHNALSGAVKEPKKLDGLATAFESQGLKDEAKLLRKRAALRRLPDETKKARSEAFRKALASKDKIAVLRMADAYDGEGCTGAAARLREVAAGLPDKIEDIQT